MLSLTLSLTAFESAVDARTLALSALLSATDGLWDSAFESAVEIKTDCEMFWLFATEKFADSTTESLTAFESATLAFEAALSAMLRAIESGEPPPESALESAVEIRTDCEMFWLLPTEKFDDSMTLFDVALDDALDASLAA